MPGDPKECRERALRCAELAMTARTPQLKTTLLDLSKKWEKLAIQLETALALLSENEVGRSDIGDSLIAAKRVCNLPKK